MTGLNLRVVGSAMLVTCVLSSPLSAQTESASGVIRMDPLLVEGDGRQGYDAKSSGMGLRTDTPILDTPAAVRVVPEALIEDQQAFTLEEALRNVSGIVLIDGGEGVQLFARGFSTQVLRNGFSRTEFTDGDLPRTEFDTVNLERIEVLKGPASVLYGRGNPGGTINLITKTPTSEAFVDASMTFGSFELYRPTLDINIPISGDGALAFRTTASYENGGSFIDEVDRERWSFAPTVGWRPSRATEVILGFEAASFHETPNNGIPAIAGDFVPGLEVGDFFNEPSDSRDSDKWAVTLRARHAFNDAWSMRAALQYSDNDSIDDTTRAEALLADGRTLERVHIDSEFNFTDLRFHTDIQGVVRLLGVENELMVGVDYAHKKYDVLFGASPAASIDIFDRDFAGTGATGTPFFVFVEDSKRDAIGAYFQNQLHLHEDVTLVGGLRFDYVAQDIENGLIGNTAAQPKKRDDALSPRIGIVYKPIETFSLYGQWSRSFQPVNAALTDVNGEILEPERGTLYEVGAKTELLDRRLTATVAGFFINRENVVTSDINNPGFLAAVGEQESRGFEIDVAGEVLPGWRVSAAYAFVEAEIGKDANFEAGNGLKDIPRHSANFWSTYEFPDGPLKGFGFGGGVQYVGERPADNANSFDLPSYLRVDATAFYKYSDTVTARLNVRNLLDEEIILNQTGDNTLGPGAPLTILGSLSVRLYD